jgi:hypothetical protein
MNILELRILPPIAVARLGASPNPLENYNLSTDPDNPLGYRRIEAAETLRLDEESGGIVEAYTPPDGIRFRDGEKIRPVAPFLEVWARTSEDELEPLTVALLEANRLTPADVRWNVRVGNVKIARRTGKDADRIYAEAALRDHKRVALEGECENFLPGKRLPLGHVQYVKPTQAFPEIRLRYTPAAGLVYGAKHKRKTGPGIKDEVDDPILTTDAQIVYDPTKDWVGFTDGTTPLPLQTNPGAIYAGWVDPDGNQISWGYLDDECDGIVSVELDVEGRTLAAQARIGAGPPTFAPDSIPIRTVHDELDQWLYGPGHDEPATIEEVEEIVRRAVETIRLLNTAAMNGNVLEGRINAASTMVRQDSNDFGRYYAPIMAPSIVDQHAVITLHQAILGAVRSGTGTWFADTLRKPEEVGDLTDLGRRKMPGMMRGADGRHLTLTRRQIATVAAGCIGTLFANAEGGRAE